MFQYYQIRGHPPLSQGLSDMSHQLTEPLVLTRPAVTPLRRPRLALASRQLCRASLGNRSLSMHTLHAEAVAKRIKDVTTSRLH
jgi:hypothetical protein